MRKHLLWIILLMLLSYSVALAQDKPQPILTVPHEQTIGGGRWHPNGRDFWTWNRRFKFADGDTDWQDYLRLWNGETGGFQNEFLYRGDNIGMYLDWSAGENRLLVYGGETLEVWDALENRDVFTYDHTARISGARWNADFSRILFWSYDDGSIHIADLNTGQSTLLVETHLESDLIEAEWSPDETAVLMVKTQLPGRVEVWDVASGARTMMFQYPSMVYGADWSADGSRILVVGDHIVQLVDVATQGVLLEKKDADYLYRADWSPDRKLAAVRLETTSLVEVWDTVNGRVISTVAHSGQPDNGIFEVLWSKDNQRLLTHSRGQIALWNAADGSKQFDISIEAPAFYMSWLSWSPDETKIAYMRSDSSLQIVPLDGGQPLDLELPTPIKLSFPSPAFAWNADESRVILWGLDNVARVWDTASGELLAELEHPVPAGFNAVIVTNALWSPDERFILTLATPDYCGGEETCPAEASVWNAP
jgi:WD40 repeat protein